jgi:hypothetical protein
MSEGEDKKRMTRSAMKVICPDLPCAKSQEAEPTGRLHFCGSAYIYCNANLCARRRGTPYFVFTKRQNLGCLTLETFEAFEVKKRDLQKTFVL